MNQNIRKIPIKAKIPEPLKMIPIKDLNSKTIEEGQSGLILQEFE